MATMTGLAAGLVGTVQAAPSLRIEPILALSETLTDNVGLSPADKRADAITRIDAGIGLRSRSGLVQGFVDYTLSELVYARDSRRNGRQNRLNAQLEAEWFERRGFVTTSATVAQQAVSAFAPQPGSDGLGGANATEVRNLRVAPRWIGRLGDDVAYSVNGDYNVSRTKDALIGDAASSGLTVHIGNARATRLGWAVDAIHQRSTYTAGRSTESDRIVGSVSQMIPQLDLQWRANVGQERGNLGAATSQSTSTWGLGATWTPSPRTRVAGDVERRSFGNSHSLTVEYRTPLTVWMLSDSRALSTNGNQLGVGSLGSNFDLAYALYASVTDPVRRLELTNDLLRAYNLDPNARTTPGFLSSAATIQDSLSLSAAARGVRSAATLTITRGSTRRADVSIAAADDLSKSDRIRTSSLGLNLSHRLTPLSTVNLTGTWLQTTGSLAVQSNKQRTLFAQYSSSLARNANWSLALRRSLYETRLVPYSESAVIATIGLRF